MNEHEIGCIIVTRDGKPVGIVTERDLLKRVIVKRKDPATTKLNEIMTKPLVTVKPDTLASNAAKIMIRKQIKKLPVTNDQNLVGILSLTDLIRVLKTHNMIDRFPIKGASNHMKKFLEAYIDPERRRKCPHDCVGWIINKLSRNKMHVWFDQDGCARRL